MSSYCKKFARCSWEAITITGASMPWLQGAQGNRSRLLQGTFYGTGIMVPYLCVIVGCHSHVGMDTTNSARGWKAMSREKTATKQRNRNHFAVDTHRSGVLS